MYLQPASPRVVLSSDIRLQMLDYLLARQALPGLNKLLSVSDLRITICCIRF
jgi:hypothetical protein